MEAQKTQPGEKERESRREGVRENQTQVLFVSPKETISFLIIYMFFVICLMLAFLLSFLKPRDSRVPSKLIRLIHVDIFILRTIYSNHLISA